MRTAPCHLLLVAYQQLQAAALRAQAEPGTFLDAVTMFLEAFCALPGAKEELNRRAAETAGATVDGPSRPQEIMGWGYFYLSEWPSARRDRYERSPHGGKSLADLWLAGAADQVPLAAAALMDWAEAQQQATANAKAPDGLRGLLEPLARDLAGEGGKVSGEGLGGASVLPESRVQAEYLDGVAVSRAQGGGEGDATSPKKPAEYVFAKSGNTYEIGGFGERGHFKKTRGFESIEKLLKNAGNPVLMVELVRGGQDDRTTADSHSRQEVLDEEAKKQIGEELRELTEDIQRADENSDLAEKERLEKKKADIESHFLAAYGLGGQDRDINNPIDKLRSRIHMALGRAYKALRKGNPSLSKLADYLEANISSEGATFKYAPTPLPDWSFDQE